MAKDLTVAVRDYAEIDRRITEYQRAELSPHSRENYDAVWQHFINFVAPKDAWRADEMDIARWMVAKAMQGVAPLTLRCQISALNYMFERAGKGAAYGHPGKGTRPSPTRELIVRQTYRGICRKHGRPSIRRDPILLDSLERMIAGQPDTLLGIRNRALLVLGWGAALRPRELEMMDAAPHGSGDGWVKLSDEGVLVTLRRSKRNQEGRRLERYGVPARPGVPMCCPVRLLRAWLEAADISRGPLFLICQTRSIPLRNRLQTQSIRKAVKDAAQGIGLDEMIGAHSLRAGCLTWLDQQGISPFRIMKHSGHQNVHSLLNYIRPPATPMSSPLMGTIWAR